MKEKKHISTKEKLIALCSTPKTLYLNTTESGEALHHYYLEYEANTCSFVLACYSLYYVDPNATEERIAHVISVQKVISILMSKFPDTYNFDGLFP